MTKTHDTHEDHAKTAEEPQEGPAAAPEAAPQRDDRQELIDHLQRLQAEFENYKKRVDRENAELCTYANAELLKRFLPILDNLELAIGTAPETERASAFFKGVELIAAQLVDLLEAHDVTPIDPALGARFDPYQHEAMLSEQKEGAEKNAVLEVLQKGYVVNGRVLRTAKVKVAK